MDIKKIRNKEIELFDLWWPEEDWEYPNCDPGVKWSPIEKILYMNFCRARKGDDLTPELSGTVHLYWFAHHARFDKTTGKAIYSDDAQSNFYEIDFIATYRHYDNYCVVCIELDGHDFHERTKEQAQMDKKKDRFLQEQGRLVARFTGSEVWNDPNKVLDSIDRLAFNTLRREFQNAKA